MKKILLGATILMGFSGAAFAASPTISFNDIAINASGSGSVTSLAIVQDAANSNNQVASSATAGSATAATVTGPWNSISITQTGNGAGGSNIMVPTIKSKTGSSTASLSATYVTKDAGDNTHALTIGDSAAPLNPNVTIAVTNSGAGNNAITDSINNGGNLTYGLTVNGTGNTISNTVAASGNVTMAITAYGSTNSIVNNASGGSSAAISESFGDSAVTGHTSSGNKVNVELTGTGSQSATLVVGAGSQVNYGLNSAGDSQMSNVTLNNVAALTGVDVAVVQGSGAASAQATLVYDGAGLTSGTTGVAQGGLPANVKLVVAASPAISIAQMSSGAYLNASVTAAGNGYSAKFAQ